MQKKADILLIEPVWNWNESYRFSTFRNEKLLIEPVWNWNAFYHKQQSLGHPSLLIEPVWNWNQQPSQDYRSHSQAFNRTSMELKHMRSNYNQRITLAFNRTSMELKRWPSHHHWRFIGRTFNRTSMELKLIMMFFTLTSGILLIEPVWNWNNSLLAWDVFLRSLLIEPVWNWNLHEYS